MNNFISAEHILVGGHRGAPQQKHENTLESFEEAISAGVDFIELDVRKTKDAVFVTIHDEKILDKTIRRLTYDEVNDIAWELGYQVPKLHDVLKILSERVMVNIELKEEGYEKEIADLAMKLIPEEELLLSSFTDKSIVLIKEFSQHIMTGLLLGTRNCSGSDEYFESEEFALRIESAKADIVLPHIKHIDSGVVERLRFLEIPTILWTLNDMNIMKYIFKNKKVAGFITDTPASAVALKKSLEKK